jgi:hypothetical protein
MAKPGILSSTRRSKASIFRLPRPVRDQAKHEANQHHEHDREDLHRGAGSLGDGNVKFAMNGTVRSTRREARRCVGWAVGEFDGDARRVLHSSTARARRLTRSQERPLPARFPRILIA